METEAIKRELGRFKGVGPKTVSCVLMFTLLRPEFPVDTHGESLRRRHVSKAVE
jgi:endonuclease-3